jgi:hypothetical protein
MDQDTDREPGGENEDAEGRTEDERAAEELGHIASNNPNFVERQADEIEHAVDEAKTRERRRKGLGEDTERRA